MIVLWSFGVKLPKWIKILTWVFFIFYVVFATIWMVFMKALDLSSLIIIILNLLLWIYILLICKTPKWLKITVWVITTIMVIIGIFACFLVPTMYESVTMNLWLNGL